MTIFVLSMISYNYMVITNGFFKPFNQYDQVVERGTNYLKMLPAGSLLNQSLQSEMTEEFKVSTIPCLLKTNDETSASFYLSHIMGIPLHQIPLLWNEYGLMSGFWPSNDSECIVGVNYNHKNTVQVGNRTLKVTGIIRISSSFLDNFIICDLNVVQIEYNLNGKISVLFIDRTIEKNAEQIINFEEKHLEIDILTAKELDSIKGGLTQFATDLTGLFSTLSTISALVFVFTIETINIMANKKDIGILKIVGATKTKIFQIYWCEVYLIILLGILIGTPISFITFNTIFTYFRTKTLPEFTFFEHFIIELDKNIHLFPLSLYIRVLMLLLVGGAILAIIPVFFAQNMKPTEDLKEKY
jgi:ABC-type antimicrobial peptide transport system permease subunit